MRNFFSIDRIHKYPLLLIGITFIIFIGMNLFNELFIYKYLLACVGESVFLLAPLVVLILFMNIFHIFHIFYAMYSIAVFKFYLKDVKLGKLYAIMGLMVIIGGIFGYLEADDRCQRIDTAIGIYGGLFYAFVLFFVALNILTLKYKIYNFNPFLNIILIHFVIFSPFYLFGLFFSNILSFESIVAVFCVVVFLVVVYCIYRLYKLRNILKKRELS